MEHNYRWVKTVYSPQDIWSPYFGIYNFGYNVGRSSPLAFGSLAFAPSKKMRPLLAHVFPRNQTHARRGAADRGQYRQAAGLVGSEINYATARASRFLRQLSLNGHSPQRAKTHHEGDL